MPIAINFKICDNASACGGIAVCPTGALSWDKGNKTIKIDNKKCLSCGLCIKECPVGAIHFAKDKEEYDNVVKEIEDDPRRVADLFVDRYGADSIHPGYLLKTKDLTKALDSGRATVVELFDDNSIRCLLKSIPVKELLAGLEANYWRLKADDKIQAEYGVEVLPALVFFRGGEMVGKVEGYYGEDRKLELRKKIQEIIG